MKRLSSGLLAPWLLIVAHLASAEDKASADFKAIGFADTRGGRGGEVIRVTTLKAEGPGSLRAALESEGPRIVVFEVGGVIDLDRTPLVIAKPFVTVAGQTAPSPGITVIRGPISIKTHDVVVQHIRVRPGDAGQPRRNGWEPDGISTAGGDAYNITIDHCSISWAIDENLSASGPRLEGPKATSRKITFSNCIIAEGLSNSTHMKGEHSKGSLIHDFCTEIAVIGNLYAHNVERNPYFKAHTTGIIVNNVIYNPGKKAIQLGFSPDEWNNSQYTPKNCRVSIVGNVMIHGFDSKKDVPLVAHLGDAYMRDNLAFDSDGNPAPLLSGKVSKLEEAPVWSDGLQPLAAKDAISHVVERAGARPRDRDETDKRIIREFQERKGRIIDSQEDVGGYPKGTATARELQAPNHGIEAWLDKLASDLE
jgi:pectate lyase